MHIFFVNKYQAEFTKSIDKTHIDIFLKYELLNFHGTIPYLDPAAAQQSQSLQWSFLLSLFSP